MSDRKILMAVLVLLAAFLVACGPTATEDGTGDATVAPEVVLPTAESPSGENMDSGSADAAEAAAVTFLASELGVDEAEIEVVSVEATEFSDSCLGLGQANESCLQAITPGWLVMLMAGGQEYELHVDETGQQVRLATPQAESPADPDAATAAATAQLASDLGVEESEIEVVSLEGADFSDSCLGLGGPDESCLQAITPGWLIMLGVGDQVYEVHTDGAGQQVRIAGETN